MSASLVPATSADAIRAVRELLVEYAAGLGLDLSFQGFEDELAGLPGAYAPPRGRLLLARVDAAAAGCVGLRPLADDTCEMKRLYVRPAFRGRGLGALLAGAAIREARGAGYARMRLDTLPAMRTARDLYRRLGFREIPAYYDCPLDGTVFLERDLRHD
ncbi:MAG TPA: GNAT family N-acetyltransferase [Gemmatimonadales bacterium]|nr:GNAT family N-acetyltransferase [Gemmatimonadales bacterium]